MAFKRPPSRRGWQERFLSGSERMTVGLTVIRIGSTTLSGAKWRQPALP
jgi:hypothetical protein